tara:strand:+ start:530 stop:760 length:231 start_codon:yes stop_codon:yes gene_type:complete
MNLDDLIEAFDRLETACAEIATDMIKPKGNATVSARDISASKIGISFTAVHDHSPGQQDTMRFDLPRSVVASRMGE